MGGARADGATRDRPGTLSAHPAALYDARMSVSNWFDLTWEEVRDELVGERTVVILPVGAIEAHGPHLPLGTDAVIAEAMARAGAEKLAAAGSTCALLPAFVYTTARFAVAFPGTISLRPETVTAVLRDLADGLAEHGFHWLAIANAHLDPDHLSAIEAARQAIAESGPLRIIFPDITRKPWAPRLTEEFRSGAAHAGRYESSVVMAERPDLVREELRARLPAVEASLSDAIRQGLESFEEAGGPRAYFGDPAAASVEEGRRTIDVLGSILAEAVLDATGR